MIRCTTYLALAVCVVAAPTAVARQPGQGPQNQSSPAATPSLIARYAGDEYDGTTGEGGYGTGGSTGGDPGRAGATSGGGSSRALEVILKASGVPNHHGQVAWPLAFRLLRADGQTRQLEGQLELAAEQVIAGGANPQLLDEIRLSVEELRQLLLADKERRFSLPLAVYEDAEDFLQKLKKAPKILAASTPAGRADAPTR
jgi:hypothetical protein